MALPVQSPALPAAVPAPAVVFPADLDPLRGRSVEELRQTVVAAIARSAEITRTLRAKGKALPRELYDALVTERSGVEWEGYAACADLAEVGVTVPEAEAMLEHVRFELEAADVVRGALYGDTGLCSAEVVR